MPYMVQAQESNNPDVEDGKYRALIEDMVSEAGTFGDTIRWKFRLLDEPYVDVQLSAMSSPTLTPNSKIWPWYVALGFEIELGMEFDLFAPIGMECWVMVERKPSKKDPALIYSNVTKIVPPPKAVSATGHAGGHPTAVRPAAASAARPVPVASPQAPRTTAPMARPAAPAARPAPVTRAPMARPAGGQGDGSIPF